MLYHKKCNSLHLFIMTFFFTKNLVECVQEVLLRLHQSGVAAVVYFGSLETANTLMQVASSLEQAHNFQWIFSAAAASNPEFPSAQQYNRGQLYVRNTRPIESDICKLPAFFIPFNYIFSNCCSVFLHFVLSKQNLVHLCVIYLCHLRINPQYLLQACSELSLSIAL